MMSSAMIIMKTVFISSIKLDQIKIMQHIKNDRNIKTSDLSLEEAVNDLVTNLISIHVVHVCNDLLSPPPHVLIKSVHVLLHRGR